MDNLTLLQRLHLDGNALMHNRGAWIHFTKLRNERWSSGNVALIGDSAHTAHFSIGSGTKLAMEDAIALAQALKGVKPVAWFDNPAPLKSGWAWGQNYLDGGVAMAFGR